MKPLALALALAAGLVAAKGYSVELPKARAAYVAAGTMPSPHATQAAAADESFVYAVSNDLVVKYDRASGKELARSTGKAQHLNSAFLWKGKLYAAHSNFPRKPHQSDLRVLDPATMELTVHHTFADPPGSLTWAVRRGEHWWCHFAHYGKDNAQSVLVRYDDRWQEQRRWTYPPQLIAEWGTYSLSGGLWQDEHLLTTGHDRRVMYRLRVPDAGKVVEVVDEVPSPFPGQGIASDPKTGGLVGIDRAKKQVVFAKFETR